jgi:integrase
MSYPPVPQESPKRRVNPSGKIVWTARYSRPDGSYAIWKPAWNRRRGTFARKGDAARAILEAYEHELALLRNGPSDTLRAYVPCWLEEHPRSKRTDYTNNSRLSRIVDVPIEGTMLGGWLLRELKRRHINQLAAHLLVEHGRAAEGARGILRVLSALIEDAIGDELADVNPVKGVVIRANDPRVKKQPRPLRVFSFDEMHAFAATAGTAWLAEKQHRAVGYVPVVQALVRMFSDSGLRLGEILPLERGDFDGTIFRSRGNAHEGQFSEGSSETKRHERETPCPPSLGALIRAMPARIDTKLLFPTPTGLLWRERNFYRDVWKPAQRAAKLDIRPHEMRHSYVSHLRAAGIDDADLADVAGHRVETMLGRYTHPLRRSFDQISEVIG